MDPWHRLQFVQFWFGLNIMISAQTEVCATKGDSVLERDSVRRRDRLEAIHVTLARYAG